MTNHTSAMKDKRLQQRIRNTCDKSRRDRSMPHKFRHKL